MAKKSYIIGIDEVGRGPLAGPVVVCALAMPANLSLRGGGRRSNLLPPLKDSKKLSKLQREAWYQWIKNHHEISYAVSRVYPRGIERLNISQAANLAATRAAQKVISHWPLATSAKIFLDGGLYFHSLVASGYPLVAKTVIKGDEKIPAISLASIVAKVIRDRFMDKLHKKYPEYGFDRHKGYGTAAHLAALKKFGRTVAHRTTFLKNFNLHKFRYI